MKTHLPSHPGGATLFSLVERKAVDEDNGGKALGRSLVPPHFIVKVRTVDLDEAGLVNRLRGDVIGLV